MTNRDDAVDATRQNLDKAPNTDIDDLKRAQEKLRQDEHELRQIVDAIPHAIILVKQVQADAWTRAVTRASVERAGTSQ